MTIHNGSAAVYQHMNIGAPFLSLKDSISRSYHYLNLGVTFHRSIKDSPRKHDCVMALSGRVLVCVGSRKCLYVLFGIHTFYCIQNKCMP